MKRDDVPLLSETDIGDHKDRQEPFRMQHKQEIVKGKGRVLFDFGWWRLPGGGKTQKRSEAEAVAAWIDEQSKRAKQMDALMRKAG